MPKSRRSTGDSAEADSNFARLIRARAAAIAAAFGALWLFAWRQQTYSESLPVLVGVVALPVLIISLAILQASRLRRLDPGVSRDYRSSRLRLYIVINAVYWPLLVAAVIALSASGHSEWVIPAIILLVGAHFFPLGRVFKDRMHGTRLAFKIPVPSTV